MSSELFMLLGAIEEEKGISREVVLEALESALISAYKRNFGATENIRVHFGEETGDIRIYAQKTVVKEVETPDNEISLEEAKIISKKHKIDDVVEFEVTPGDFGRIAAQTARQVVLQRIREAERERVFDEVSGKTNEIVSAVVKRIDRRNVVVEIGDMESILMPNEQSSLDRYVPGERFKVYVTEVVNSARGVHMVVSRSHPMLVRKLFELEVPEIEGEIIEIKGLTRESGSRTKLAVASNNSDVDAVGTCIGPRGMRVQNVIDELRGEKIDIIRYSDDPAEFITNALSPAKVSDTVLDEEAKICKVTVPSDQLSLAIGKEGQNARLAARLTNWKIDIKGV